jgi:hypothetical protein
VEKGQGLPLTQIYPLSSEFARLIPNSFTEKVICHPPFVKPVSKSNSIYVSQANSASQLDINFDNYSFEVELDDKRLNKRYTKMVLSHLVHNQHTAAGICPPSKIVSSFATTQAAWRFLNNPKVTPNKLIQPIRAFASKQLTETQDPYLPGAGFSLLVTDWSKIDYKNHTSKKDIVQLTHKDDVGYELTTSLLVNAQNGLPIAPMELHLKTSDTIYTTGDNPVVEGSHLEQVLPIMNSSRTWNLSTFIVHVIDREADSLWHFRQWSNNGHLFLVRGDDDRLVSWQDHECRYSEIADTLEKEGQFQKTIDLMMKKQKCYQEVAETEIVLSRAARHKINGKTKNITGNSLSLRLVVSRIRNKETNAIVSVWYLLTNVNSLQISAGQIALWYYWRWKIESYFKLMKSSGLEMEHWQQETGIAIMNRLLVSAMALSTIWSLQEQTSEEAIEFKDLLVRLSGKTHKPDKPYTDGILLSGLFVLLRIFDFLESCDYDFSKVKQIRDQAKKFIPYFFRE